MNKWAKKAKEVLAGFHGIGTAVQEVVAAALEAAYEEGRAAPPDDDEEAAPGQG